MRSTLKTRLSGRRLKKLDMAKSLIIQGLKEAVRHAREDNSSNGRVMHVEHPLDVKAIRQELGLTQERLRQNTGIMRDLDDCLEP